ncbi:hypothetical protein M0R45_036539 [Rubus argutus]|uniref:Cyclic nucleotide-binding domain-containing protein n=1 Tax=Rubus argutus TaxID=59490 RepID=A0AAW1VZ55_RUBAR
MDCHSELESGKRGGGKGWEFVPVESRNTWNTVFTISCALAIFVDPWYLYAAHVIHHTEYKCWERDLSLLWTYIGLRSAVDVFYVIDFLTSLRVIRFGSKAVTAPTHKLPKLHVLYLILVGFPLPEGLILLSSKCLGVIKYDGDLTYALMISTPIQYSLRVYHIYESLRQRRPILKTGIGKWLLQAIMDFLPFILASHLFGALWYRLAIQRHIDCWKRHCVILLGDHCKSNRSHDFYCEDRSPPIIGNLSKWDELCPVKEADPEVFDFGIYLYALQSNVTRSTNVARRMSQSFWWALRNLSSFGSNLQTSMNTVEIILSVLISISGMALFLVYLNARVQFKLEKKNKLMEPDIESWLQKNRPSSDLLSHQNDLPPKNMVTAIMENIHKLGDDKDIDLKNMLSILPMKDQKSIICFLCFDSLRKVPVLAKINDNILRAICEKFKPVIYTEDSYIVQQGKPQGKMLFLVQGSAYTYTTSCNINEVGPRNEWLKSGDFYGQELLAWAFETPSISDLPISTRTVMCQEKIEAFVIRAGDLKSVAISSGILAEM